MTDYEVFKRMFFLTIRKARRKEQEILLRHFGFGESLRTIARKDKISHQGVAHRIKVALKYADVSTTLLRCIGIHWQEMRIYGNHFHHKGTCQR